VITQALFADPGAFVTPHHLPASAMPRRLEFLGGGAGPRGLRRWPSVPESDIGRLVLGQGPMVRVDAFPDRRFGATGVRQDRASGACWKPTRVTSFEVKTGSWWIPTYELAAIGMDRRHRFPDRHPRRRNPRSHCGCGHRGPGRPRACWLVARNDQPHLPGGDAGLQQGRNTP